MEPARKLMVSTCQGIGDGERRHEIPGEKKCVCHKEALLVYLR
jgi:hypothetical protein